VPASSSTAAPGFFGKLPAVGDFLSRRVPLSVRAEWEAWLAALVVEARNALGDAWPDDWLTAPLWHFVLGSGITPPAGASGVLIASTDRVGRMFPFTIIGAAAGEPSADGTAINEWARQAEALTLGALDDGFDPDVLDAALQELGPPPAVQGATRTTGHWRLAFDGDWPRDAPDGSAGAGRQPPAADQSAWWCRGSGRVEPMHLCCTGLPGPATAAAMITGAFDFTNI
jgi:type VI secretion system protein ImpM